MKKLMPVLLLSFFLLGMVFLPGCKTAESWSPIGTWTLNISTPDWGRSWTDTLTFSGNESGGSVTGLTPDHMLGPQTGTWTKTGDYGISMSFSFILASLSEVVNLTGNSSEANQNSMTGGGTWTEGVTVSVSWNAIR